MVRYAQDAVERAMKVQEVILRAAGGKLQWFEAAEILGISCRTMHRWKMRYERDGYDGLFDRRRRQPSPKRVPMKQVQQVLQLYRDGYAGFNVRHFHEKLTEEHGIKLSYAWVKAALQTAGLVNKGRRKVAHRQRRERRPMRGMMLFCDGSTHAWLPLADQRQDLIAFVDDATSEVYEAYLVPEEGTLTVMAGLKAILQREGLFCSLYTDRGSHFFHTPRVDGPVDKSRLTQIGRALQRLGIEAIPSYSPQARGRMERFFGTWQGRLPQELRRAGITTMEAANTFIRKKMIPWHNRKLAVAPAQTGHTFVPCSNVDLDEILCIQEERIVQQDNTVVLDHVRFQIPPHHSRPSFARCTVRICQHLDQTITIRCGPHLLGRYRNDGIIIDKQTTRKVA
jgi:transposase